MRPQAAVQIVPSSTFVYSKCHKSVPFGYGCYVIRRNNAMPFVNGGISASMKSEQPQWTDGHEAVYSIRLYNFIIVYSGASSKSLNRSSANHITPIPKQDSSYRNIIMTTAIMIAISCIERYETIGKIVKKKRALVRFNLTKPTASEKVRCSQRRQIRIRKGNIDGFFFQTERNSTGWGKLQSI